MGEGRPHASIREVSSLRGVKHDLGGRREECEERVVGVEGVWSPHSMF